MVEFGWVGGGEGGGELSWGLTSLNRPHCGGGRLVWERFPCSQQPPLPQAKGREGTGEQWQKDREGAPRGDDGDEKTPHTTGGGSAGGAGGGPGASKVATGEK